MQRTEYGGIAQLGEQITSKAAHIGEHKSESRKSKKLLRRNDFSAYGGIAQLGERLNGIQKVSGSIPLISTKTTNRKVKNLAVLSYLEVLMHPTPIK